MHLPRTVRTRAPLARLVHSLPLAAFLAAPPLASGQSPAVGLHAGSDFTLEQYEAFGAWLGREVMYRIVFLDKRSWALIGNPSVLPISAQWVNSRPGRVEVISVPLLPDGENGNFAAVTGGSRDTEFKTIATRIRNAGIADRVFIRLGWEGNGDWYPWSFQQDPAGYRAAFRRVVGLMRAIAPELRFDFNISNLAPRRAGGAKWTAGYPGDDVVDVISMDIYDHFNWWNDMMTGDAGLYEFREFAKLHDKPEAYAEWACAVTTNGHGDNAGFIRAMAAWMAARPGRVLYQAYWNSTEGAGALLLGATQALLADSASTYQRLFGPNTPPSITGLPHQSLNVNATTGPIPFTIDDAQTPREHLSIITNSSNPAVVPRSGIIVNGSAGNRTVTISPAANTTGWTTIWVKVSDGELDSVASFVVNVSAGLAFADVGTPLLAGSHAASGHAITMHASGYDIYRQKDEFHFGQTALHGDAELTVRVASLTHTHAWTKAGLMFRATLAPDAAYVAVLLTPGNGVVLQWRGKTGGYAASSSSVVRATPQYLRLLRTADTFYAFCSNDGREWEFVESAHVTLPYTAAAGLALVSHAPHARATAVFEGLRID